MKKRNKFFAVMLVITLASSVAFGCTLDVGGGGDDGGLIVEVPELIENPDATTTIKVSTLSSKVETGVMTFWANGYMRKNPDVQIRINGNLNSMGDLATWRPNHQMPDICWTAGDQHSKWSNDGYFDDLRQYAVEYDEGFFDGFYPSLIDTTHYSTKDEGIWFMPRDYNKIVCYVNNTLLEREGLTVPDETWTYDDMLKLCADWKKKMPDDVNYPVEIDYSWQPVSVTLMKNYGASVYTDGILTADSPEMKTCLESINQMVQDKWFGRTTGSFNTLDSPILVGARPNLPLVISATLEDKCDVSVLPFPSTQTADNGVGYVGVGCSGYAICADSKVETKEASWEFLKYCMSEEGYNEVGAFGSITPALENLAGKGTWTQVKNAAGKTVNANAFTGGLAEAVSVNFCANLNPSNQNYVQIQFQDLFNSVLYSSFDYQKKMDTFIASISKFK